MNPNRGFSIKKGSATAIKPLAIRCRTLKSKLPNINRQINNISTVIVAIKEVSETLEAFWKNVFIANLPIPKNDFFHLKYTAVSAWKCAVVWPLRYDCRMFVGELAEQVLY